MTWLCYLGALIDAGAAIQMLWPWLFGVMYGIESFSPGADYRYAMGMGASLMLGWSALLIWTARRPLERSGVLLITVLPVIAGLIVNELVGVWSGFVELAAVVPVLVLQLLLSSAAIVAAVRVRSSGHEQRLSGQTAQ